MEQNTQKPKRRFDWLFIILVLITIVGIVLLIRYLTTASPVVLNYSDLITRINNNEITKIIATPVGGENYGMYELKGVIVTSNSQRAEFYSYVLENQLNELMSGTVGGVALPTTFAISIEALTQNIWLSLLISLIPYVITFALFFFIFTRLMKSQGGAGGAFDFAKSTAKLSRNKTVTFKDVAGCDEEKEELVEIIDFLKNPRKYNEIGARVPKGVLLFGPPGTGKTLLAKAVAGEAGVPFFSISGSDFVEMFVGVGASRVRDMFKTAKENAPCIIFIDEIDAVGRQRGAGMGGGHDEREQTLNQLLVEMDGFSGNTGIIIMAATNRPDVLDPALLRPGRFDRQITINNPDVRGREEILKVHARNKHLDPSIKFDEVAQRIPGFSGADIENLLNEAALLAARDNRKVINTQDIDEAMDRVMMGPAKKSKKYNEKERTMVAYHEAGHAVIGLMLENASLVQKVTIIPRGQAGGYNLMMPKDETYTKTKSELLDSICGYLGGRISEEIMFKEISTGAYDDLKRATRIARAMVAEYGMSDLGPIQYEEQSGSVFLGRDYLKEKNFSDTVAAEIDQEVRKIIFDCHKKATETIQANLDLLNNIAKYLLKVETLTKPDIDEIKETGKLGWYDEKEAQKQAEKEAEEKSKQEETSANDAKEEAVEVQAITEEAPQEAQPTEEPKEDESK